MTGIPVIHHRAPGSEAGRALLVMLPGVGIEAAAFAEQGMVAAVQAYGLAVDIAAAHPDLALYLDGGLAAALHESVVAPALAQGYARIWLLGISLGGMGAMLYASAYPAHVEGLVLLAPFLGTKGMMAELAKAGGLASWRPDGSMATDLERTALTWLQTRPARLYLGYGAQDRFAAGHALLAGLLPADHVTTIAGGHDWQTWGALWRLMLKQVSGHFSCEQKA